MSNIQQSPGGGKVTVTNLAAGNVRSGVTITVKQGNKVISSVAGTVVPRPGTCAYPIGGIVFLDYGGGGFQGNGIHRGYMGGNWNGNTLTIPVAGVLSWAAGNAVYSHGDSSGSAMWSQMSIASGTYVNAGATVTVTIHSGDDAAHAIYFFIYQ